MVKKVKRSKKNYMFTFEDDFKIMLISMYSSIVGAFLGAFLAFTFTPSNENWLFVSAIIMGVILIPLVIMIFIPKWLGQ